jgi:hypothetical protein
MEDSARYKKAIGRNLAELQWAQIHRTTMQGIEQAKPVYHYFHHSVYNSLFNDYISRCIKVLERSSQSASFWYIYKTNAKRVDDYCAATGIDLSEIEAFVPKLKHVRDKTHFHIDFDGVLDPKQTWADADINGKALGAALDSIWKILTHLQELLALPEVSLPHYTIKSAKEAARRVEESRVGL